MNNRMPFFSLTAPPPPPPPPPQQINSNYHNNFPPPFHPTTPPPSISPNWDTRNNGRNGWKRWNWNHNHQYNAAQPYTVPKKQFVNRFQQNRMNNNGSSYYENNAPTPKWNNKNQQHTEPKEKEQSIPGIVANKKKRKPMSKSYPTIKWDEKDAERALAVEEYYGKNLTTQSLIIKFPDTELSKDTVKEFHPAIDSVHFPNPSAPRYCFVHLKEDSKINDVIDAIEKIPFGQGYLQAELKKAQEDKKLGPKDIDPYTLYVGNLPLNVTKAGVISYFQGCSRIDIGHPQQMKNTRYAFVRFSNVDDAISAYKNTVNTLYESRSLVVRFRRINGNVGMPGEPKEAGQKTKENSKETPSQTSVSSSTNSIPLLPDIHTPPPSMRPSPSSIPVPSKQPDLSLVKEEPVSDGEEVCSGSQDIKPKLCDLESTMDTDTFSNYSDTTIKSEFPIKNEHPVHKNEDEIEDEDEEDEFDARNDNFKYNEAALLEDECEDFDDEDDYDLDDDDFGLQMNGTDSYLPGDDDEDIFTDK